MIYGYLRVSTDAQDVHNQKLCFSSWEETTGNRIDKYIEDNGVSGATDFEERNLGRLLKNCKEGDTIVAAEISRLGRNLFMVMRFLEKCMQKKLNVQTIKDGYNLSDDIQSKVLAFAFGLAAEIERDLFLKRSKEALNRFTSRGGVLRSVSKSPRLKLTPFHEKIVRMCSEGRAIAYIGRCFGVSGETVSRYIETMGIPYKKKAVCNNDKNHKARNVKLEVCRSTIIYGIREGMTYQEIYEHVKKCHHVRIAEKSIRTYIQHDKELLQMWCDYRNKSRLEANIKASWKRTKQLQYERDLDIINGRITAYDKERI